jgi:hypothetical protein
MGDVFRILGRNDEACQAQRKSLDIIERLVQAEPGRADYQRHLMVSWFKMSESEPSSAREHLSRALAIARSLHEQGRLAPVDAWMVDDFARRLSALTAAKEPAGPSPDASSAPSLMGRVRRWMRRRG